MTPFIQVLKMCVTSKLYKFQSDISSNLGGNLQLIKKRNVKMLITVYITFEAQNLILDILFRTNVNHFYVDIISCISIFNFLHKGHDC